MESPLTSHTPGTFNNYRRHKFANMCAYLLCNSTVIFEYLNVALGFVLWFWSNPLMPNVFHDSQKFTRRPNPLFRPKGKYEKIEITTFYSLWTTIKSLIMLIANCLGIYSDAAEQDKTHTWHNFFGSKQSKCVTY